MAQTIEERVANLEKGFATLANTLPKQRPVQKDWRKTIGMCKDDELAREASRLGREYRQQQTEP